MAETRNAHTILVGKPEGNRAVGRNSHRWKDDIKMDLTEISVRMWPGFILLRIGSSYRLM
jgi:hypothetical protein